MSTQLQRRLFNVKEYHLMATAGIFAEDDRLELLEGEIVGMAPIGSRHAACVKRLNSLLSAGLSGRVIISVQDPVQLGQSSEPQPDLALLVPREDFYASRHPQVDDLLLLVEVADTTIETDRDVKLPLYARAGVEEVWLIDLAVGLVETYRGPSPDGYREVQQHGPGDHIAPQAFPDLSLAVNEVL